jgi:NitT/TauT family transport system permease protein
MRHDRALPATPTPTLPRKRGREQTEFAARAIPISEAEEVAPRQGFAERHRKLLLGCLTIALFFAAWQALFLVIPLNTLFMSTPSLIGRGLLDLIATGQLFDDLRVSAVPFLYGFVAAVVAGVAIGVVMGWRARVGYALDPLMTALYASPLVALAPLVVVFFGVGVAGKAIIIFSLAVFPFIFNAYAGVRAVDPLLINVIRSLGGTEKDLYSKVILPSTLPYIVAGARLAIGRALVGVLVAEFFAASEGIGYAIARFGDLYALDRMFACILAIMVIAVALTEAVRWAERAAFPWRVGQ